VIRWRKQELLLLKIELTINATKKVVTVTKRYAVHDSKFNSSIGDKVLIREIAPLSKTKNWLVTKVID